MPERCNHGVEGCGDSGDHGHVIGTAVYRSDPYAPDGLPPCVCTHAGERHRGDTQGSYRTCEQCQCRAYTVADPNAPVRKLTLGALSAGRPLNASRPVDYHEPLVEPRRPQE